MTYHDEVTTPKRTRIGLVACAAGKLDHPAPAGEIYTSQLFRKAAAYAAATCDRWYILSAKHGLLRPEDVVEPYDERLPRNPNHEDVQRWADTVRHQLAYELREDAGVSLVFLAGAAYRAVASPCQWPFEVPMAGLGIGQQLAFLTNHTEGK